MSAFPDAKTANTAELVAYAETRATNGAGSINHAALAGALEGIVMSLVMERDRLQRELAYAQREKAREAAE